MEPTAPKKVSPQCAYYYRNREVILQREKEKKRWIKYYAENKEAVKERRQRILAPISTPLELNLA